MSQNFDGEDLPICFISRSFQKAELNKSTIMKELLAIHFAVTYLRPYLYGQKFLVRSDHKPLVFLYNLKNPASKLTQIRLDLDEYDFTVEHIPGKHNVVADALSRIHIDDIKQLRVDDAQILAMTRSMTKKLQVEDVEAVTKPDMDTSTDMNVFVENNRKKLKAIPEIKFYFEDYPNMRARIKIISKRKVLSNITVDDFVRNDGIISSQLLLGEFFCSLQRSARDLGISQLKFNMNNPIFGHVPHEEFMSSGNNALQDLIIMLCNPTKIVHDEHEKLQIIRQYHESAMFGGHFGINKTCESIRRDYFWPKMTIEISNYVKNCKNYSLNKPRQRTREEMTITNTPNRPFDTIIIDTIGPLHTTIDGNKYALTMICDLSRFLITAPMPNKEAQTIAKSIFDNLILIHGPMKVLRSDLGTEFNNELIGELCKLMNVEHKMSTSYHHESVGTVERNHRVFNEYMRSYLVDSNWELYLKHFTFCYNASFNASINHEYTPYEIVYGKRCNLPSSLTDRIDPLYDVDNYVKTQKFVLQKMHARVKELVTKSKLANKQIFDKNARPLDVEVNDKVLLRKEPYDKQQRAA